MKNIVLKCIIALICVNMAIGCATIIHQTDQDISVYSNPSEAEIWVDGVKRGTTPMVVNLERKHSYIFEIKKEGFKSNPIYVKSEVSPWILGNVLIGGLIGCGIDFISGGAYTLSPDKLEINMEEASVLTQGVINIPAEQFDSLEKISLVNGEGIEQVVINIK